MRPLESKLGQIYCKLHIPTLCPRRLRCHPVTAALSHTLPALPLVCPLNHLSDPAENKAARPLWTGRLDSASPALLSAGPPFITWPAVWPDEESAADLKGDRRHHLSSDHYLSSIPWLAGVTGLFPDVSSLPFSVQISAPPAFKAFTESIRPATLFGGCKQQGSLQGRDS